MFDALFSNPSRPVLLAFLLLVNSARAENAAPPPSVPATNAVAVAAQPAPSSPSEEENQKQRVMLLSLMAVLIGIAVWRKFPRRA